MERLLCKECECKFFGGDFNKYTCPKCKTVYIRKSKKVDIKDFISVEIPDE